MAALSLSKPRHWRVWIPTEVEPAPADYSGTVDDGAVSAIGPDAWVKGGHLFVGDSKTQQWSKAWAPGGWLSCELLDSE